MRLTIHLTAACLCLVLMTGCVTKPSRYYLLTPVEQGTAGTLNKPEHVIGIGPVTFPAYLDRPQIVLRSSGNQLDYAESHRWAEPLKSAFSQTLAENLSTLLPAERTVIYPWSRSILPDYQVIVKVTRFDADVAGMVNLTADWEIIRASDTESLDQNKVTYTETANSTEYPAIVGAQSRAVEQLSRDIAAAISETRQ